MRGHGRRLEQGRRGAYVAPGEVRFLERALQRIAVGEGSHPAKHGLAPAALLRRQIRSIRLLRDEAVGCLQDLPDVRQRPVQHQRAARRVEHLAPLQNRPLGAVEEVVNVVVGRVPSVEHRDVDVLSPAGSLAHVQGGEQAGHAVEAGD